MKEIKKEMVNEERACGSEMTLVVWRAEINDEWFIEKHSDPSGERMGCIELVRREEVNNRRRETGVLICNDNQPDSWLILNHDSPVWGDRVYQEIEPSEQAAVEFFQRYALGASID